MTNRHGDSTEPVADSSVRIRSQRQTCRFGDTVGDRRHPDRVSPNMLSELRFAQLLETAVEFVHRELFSTKQKITPADGSQCGGDP
ncbi:hypothetical protein ACW9HQ_44690, partial [Nocardia gipuzkoensis]